MKPQKRQKGKNIEIYYDKNVECGTFNNSVHIKIGLCQSCTGWYEGKFAVSVTAASERNSRRFPFKKEGGPWAMAPVGVAPGSDLLGEEQEVILH